MFLCSHSPLVRHFGPDRCPLAILAQRMVDASRAIVRRRGKLVTTVTSFHERPSPNLAVLMPEEHHLVSSFQNAHEH